MTTEPLWTEKLVERGNDLAVESARTLVDSAYFAQTQALELSQAMLKSVEANHRTSRDLAGKLVSQALEVQSLWWQLAWEPLRITADVYARATRSALEEVDRALAAAETASASPAPPRTAEKTATPAGK